MFGRFFQKKYWWVGVTNSRSMCFITIDIRLEIPSVHPSVRLPEKDFTSPWSFFPSFFASMNPPQLLLFNKKGRAHPDEQAGRQAGRQQGQPQEGEEEDRPKIERRERKNRSNRPPPIYLVEQEYKKNASDKKCWNVTDRNNILCWCSFLFFL